MNNPNFKQTEIGMIPEDWEVKHVSNFCLNMMKEGKELDEKIKNNLKMLGFEVK